MHAQVDTCPPTGGCEPILQQGLRLNPGQGVGANAPMLIQGDIGGNAICDVFASSNLSGNSYFIPTRSFAEYTSLRQATDGGYLSGVSYQNCGCGDGFCMGPPLFNPPLEDCGPDDSGAPNVRGNPSCASDCGTGCPPICGDGYCPNPTTSSIEHCAAIGNNIIPECNLDCGTCPCGTPFFVCGPADCGSCPTCSPCCGDNSADAGEQCDGTDLGGQDCIGLGYGGGVLGCTGSCIYDTTNCGGISCPNSFCGDSVCSGSETCGTCPGDCAPTSCGDGCCAGTESCATLAGTNINNGECENDCGYCGGALPFCGNNIREGSEVCDGTDLNGNACTTFGYVSGNLACNGSCTGYDTSGCISSCWSGTGPYVWCGFPGPNDCPANLNTACTQGATCSSSSWEGEYTLPGGPCEGAAGGWLRSDLSCECWCGNGSCDPGETAGSCPADCGTPAINGQCGSTVNSCLAGTLNDLLDLPGFNNWQCVGSGGGTTANCALAASGGCTYTHPQTGNPTTLVDGEARYEPWNCTEYHCCSGSITTVSRSPTCPSSGSLFPAVCGPSSNCSAATDGPAGTQCSVPAMNHGDNIGGTCDDIGSCSASCSNGTLTFTNNCMSSVSCPACPTGSFSGGTVVPNYGTVPVGSCGFHAPFSRNRAFADPQVNCDAFGAQCGGSCVGTYCWNTGSPPPYDLRCDYLYECPCTADLTWVFAIFGEQCVSNSENPVADCVPGGAGQPCTTLYDLFTCGFPDAEATAFSCGGNETYWYLSLHYCMPI